MYSDKALRYTDQKDEFLKFMREYCNRNKLTLTEEIEKKIWNYLQEMEEPINFHMGYAWELATK